MPNLVTYRLAQWEHLIPLPGPGTYRFLANGDSWFSIGALPPFDTTNLLKEMTFETDTVAVDFSEPGAKAGQMWGVDPTSTWVYDPAFTGMLNGGSLAYKWDGILLSAGGNDLIAAALTPLVDSAGNTVPPESRILLTSSEWKSQSDASRYVSDTGWAKFETHLTAVFGDLIAMRDSPTSKSQGAPVFVHSYCYVQPRNVGVGVETGGKWTGGPWLYNAVKLYSIPEDQWLSLAEYLIDELFAILRNIASQHQNMLVLDFRTELPPAQPGSTGVDGDWENEIHPTSDGYSKLGALYSQAVQAAISTESRLAANMRISDVLSKPVPNVERTPSIPPAPPTANPTSASTARRMARRH